MISPGSSRFRRTHVRRPALPWRDSRVTECGDGVDQFAADLVIDRATLVAQVQAEGIRTVRERVCRMCLANTQRLLASTWADDPVKLLAREISTLALYPDRDPEFVLELRAIAALVAAHRGEFDQAVADLRGMPSLARARERRRRPDRR